MGGGGRSGVCFGDTVIARGYGGVTRRMACESVKFRRARYGKDFVHKLGKRHRLFSMSYYSIINW